MAPSAESNGAPRVNVQTNGDQATANGHTNGHANGHVKEQINGHANGNASPYAYPPSVQEGAPYRVLKQYHSKPTKLRVACIGAGASGLCLAYKMGKMMVPDSWELTLFEKNPHFGGTWYENT